MDYSSTPGAPAKRAPSFSDYAQPSPQMTVAVLGNSGPRLAKWTTREITPELHSRGFRFEGAGRFETRTRAWLVAESCFHELSPGRWSLRYHAAELPVEA